MSGDAPSCSCGTFAIGRCGECREFVCGSHSFLKDGLRICVHHEHAHMAAEVERQRADRLAQAAVDLDAALLRSGQRKRIRLLARALNAAGGPGAKRMRAMKESIGSRHARAWEVGTRSVTQTRGNGAGYDQGGTTNIRPVFLLGDGSFAFLNGYNQLRKYAEGELDEKIGPDGYYHSPIDFEAVVKVLEARCAKAGINP